MNLLPSLQPNAFSSESMGFQETYARVVGFMEFKFYINNRLSEKHLFGGQMP